jgi:hypothetical protein
VRVWGDSLQYFHTVKIVFPLHKEPNPWKNKRDPKMGNEVCILLYSGDF